MTSLNWILNSLRFQGEKAMRDEITNTTNSRSNSSLGGWRNVPKSRDLEDKNEPYPKTGKTFIFLLILSGGGK